MMHLNASHQNNKSQEISKVLIFHIIAAIFLISPLPVYTPERQPFRPGEALTQWRSQDFDIGGANTDEIRQKE